jgi:hypothetical protein
MYSYNINELSFGREIERPKSRWEGCFKTLCPVHVSLNHEEHSGCWGVGTEIKCEYSGLRWAPSSNWCLNINMVK